MVAQDVQIAELEISNPRVVPRETQTWRRRPALRTPISSRKAAMRGGQPQPVDWNADR